MANRETAELPDIALSGQIVGGIETLVEMIAALGSEEFGKLVTRWVKESEPIDFVVINLHDSHYGLISRIGELTKDQKQVASVVDKHSTFRFDPNSELIQGLRNRTVQPLLNRVRFEDIANKRYHNLFFERFNLIDRLSIISPKVDSWLVTSFYRTAGSGQFSDADASHLAQLGSFLNTLGSKHLGLLHAADMASGDPDRNLRAIERCQSQLSARECEVCAHLLCGKTNSEVAASLHIEMETVRTLRKRAYQKIGVDNLTRLQASLVSRFL